MREKYVFKVTKRFYLIEIIVVIVILSIVSGITVKFLVDSLRIYTMTVNQKTLLDEGKLALERMCRDIRDAQSISQPAAGGSDSQIRFVRTHATSQDQADESLRFRLSGTTLQKRKSQPPPAFWVDLASNVSTFTVTRGAAATNNLNEITLVLNLQLATGENVTLQTKVYPKNFGDSTTYKNFRVPDSSGNFASWEEVRSP